MATYIDDRNKQLKQYLDQPRFIWKSKAKERRRINRALQLKDISTFMMLTIVQVFRPTGGQLEMFYKALPITRLRHGQESWDKVEGINKVIRLKLKKMAKLGLIEINEVIALTQLGHDVLNTALAAPEGLMEKLSPMAAYEYQLMRFALERDGVRAEARTDQFAPWTFGQIKAGLELVTLTSNYAEKIIMYFAGIAVASGLVLPHEWK